MSVFPFKRKGHKDNNDTSFKADAIPNTNGWVPIKRMFIVWSVILVITAALGYVAWEQILITRPPNYTLNPSGLAYWALMSLVIPHIIVYILSIASSYFILTQSTGKYLRWLSWESKGKIITNFAIMEALLILVLVGGMLGMPENAFFQTVENTDGMTQTSSYLWNVSFLALTVPAWVGYSTAWKTYRLVGAQTMQDRYEKHLKDTEIKNSGQWWDRMAKIKIPAFFGWDGNSPKFMLLWFVLANVVLASLVAPANVLEISVLYGIALFGAPTMLVAVFAAVSKRRDGKITYRHPQYLAPVRGPDTEDTYDPSKTGVRQFDRT